MDNVIIYRSIMNVHQIKIYAAESEAAPSTTIYQFQVSSNP